MLGAIIGDIVGSYYEVLEVDYLKKNKTNRPYEERIKILDKKVPLFTDELTYTDDTVLTCAIYDAIKNGNCDYSKYLKEYGLREINLGLDRYGRERFGKGFIEWLNDESLGNSYGNGAAMRVSPVGFLFDDYKKVRIESMKATIPTHNNVDAITGAEAVAVSIYLLRNGMNKKDVINSIKADYYDLNYRLEDLQKYNKFSSATKDTVPVSLYVFSVSKNFEDALRNAISVGGDTDTITSIVGALSEACWGVPEDMKDEIKKYLTDDMINLLDSYYGEKIWKK